MPPTNPKHCRKLGVESKTIQFSISSEDTQLVNTALLWCPPPANIPSLRDSGSEATLRQRLKQLVVDAGVAPGASVAAAVRHQGLFYAFRETCGTTTYDGTEPIAQGHLFDLASITKSVFAFVMGRLHDRGVLDLRSPLSDYLPWSAQTPSGQVPLHLLLAHRSGLRAHVQLFDTLRDAGRFDRAESLLRAATSLRPECSGPLPSDGFSPAYSDLGYILLGEAVERVCAEPLSVCVTSELRSVGVAGVPPELGAAETLPRAPKWCVPTEVTPWRGGTLKGSVHDDNAFALCGQGLSGHAGAFGTAAAVLRFGCMLLDCVRASALRTLPIAGVVNGAKTETALLTPATLGLLLNPRPGGTLKAGFDGKSSGQSVVGTRLGPQTFGHLGFTGTSFWCDPESETVVVLLTNRVHPSRENPKIGALRPKVHDLLAECAGELALRA